METVLEAKQTADYFKDEESKRILITGASGFLGEKLYKRLDGGRSPFIWPLSRFHGVDVRRRGQVDMLMERVAGGSVYHLAAKVSYNKRDSAEILETNVNGTQNVLESAKKYGIKKVVVVSSAVTCGFCKHPYITKSEVAVEKDESNPYVRSKVLQEMLAKYFNAVIVAPTTCYLPFMAGTVIPPGGTNVVAVDDVVEGLICAMKYGRARQKYILGGYNVRYSDIYKMAGRKFIVAPRWTRRFLMLAAKFSSDWYMSPFTVGKSFSFSYFDSGKARRELRWIPNINLKEMIKQQA